MSHRHLLLSLLFLASACSSTPEEQPVTSADMATPSADMSVADQGARPADQGTPAADQGVTPAVDMSTPVTADMDPTEGDMSAPPVDQGPVAQPNPYGPPGAFFNQDVSQAPVAEDSDTIIKSLRKAGGWGNNDRFQIDFSIDMMVSSPDSPKYPVMPNGNFYTPDCDPAPMPLPEGGNIEGEQGYSCTKNGDCHLLVYAPHENRLYEMYRADLRGDQLLATCLAIWDTSIVYPETGRGEQCTSSDAAGFPITPLLFTADEVAAGEINHAIRFILPNDRVRARQYVRPATHGTKTTGDADAPPYGVHFRLRADYPLESLPNEGARVVARALQRYGMYHADGGKITLTAMSDRHTTAKWDGLLGPHDLRALKVEDFEVIHHSDTIPVTFECKRTPLTE